MKVACPTGQTYIKHPLIEVTKFGQDRKMVKVNNIKRDGLYLQYYSLTKPYDSIKEH